MAEAKEVEVDLDSAVADTEREIFEAVDDEALALEAMEDPAGFNPDDRAAHDADEKEQDGDAEEHDSEGDDEDKESDEEDRDDKGRFKSKEDESEDRQGKRGIPSSRLREEAAARREAERRADDLAKRLDEMLARQTAAQTQPTKTEEPKAPAAAPDIFTDPEGYQKHVDAQFQARLSPLEQRLEKQRVEFSLQVASARHGDKYAAADKAVAGLDARNPEHAAVMRSIVSAQNPGEAMIEWFDRQKAVEAAREIGDPAKYREKIKAELLEELRKDAQTGNAGRPRTTVKVPKSLSSASGGSAARSGARADYANDDKSVFGSAFED